MFYVLHSVVYVLATVCRLSLFYYSLEGNYWKYSTGQKTPAVLTRSAINPPKVNGLG